MKMSSGKRKLRLPSKLYLVVARHPKDKSLHAMSEGLTREEAIETASLWKITFKPNIIEIEGSYERCFDNPFRKIKKNEIRKR